jgi:peptidoglycan hydrolase-like protein with peptidoglycan-binding domain
MPVASQTSTTSTSTTLRPPRDDAARTHVVRTGDTLWDLSRTYGTDVATLRARNPQLAHIPDTALPIGMRLNVGAPAGAPARATNASTATAAPTAGSGGTTTSGATPAPARAPADATTVRQSRAAAQAGESAARARLASSTLPTIAGGGWLARGARGAEVEKAQQLLGLPRKAQDGVFGPQTERAVRDFQSAHGLNDDGVIGRHTLEALTRTGGRPASTTATTATAAHLPIVGYDTAYENGRNIGRIALTEIEGKRVSLPTAKAYLAMREAARRDGVELQVVSGFRDNAKQAYLYNGFVNRRPGFNPANPPGYSNHQNGRALDLNTDGPSRSVGSGRVYNWLAQNASRFGFHRIPSEHWHWELRR